MFLKFIELRGSAVACVNLTTNQRFCLWVWAHPPTILTEVAYGWMVVTVPSMKIQYRSATISPSLYNVWLAEIRDGRCEKLEIVNDRDFMSKCKPHRADPKLWTWRPGPPIIHGDKNETRRQSQMEIFVFRSMDAFTIQQRMDIVTTLGPGQTGRPLNWPSHRRAGFGTGVGAEGQCTRSTSGQPPSPPPRSTWTALC